MYALGFFSVMKERVPGDVHLMRDLDGLSVGLMPHGTHAGGGVPKFVFDFSDRRGVYYVRTYQLSEHIPPPCGFFTAPTAVYEKGIYMFDIKEIKNVVQQIAETRQLSEDSLWAAIEIAFAAAYKKEYAKSDQIIRARINRETGDFDFFQAKQVLDETKILPEGESAADEEDTRVHFNQERHIMVGDAQLVRQGVEAGEEILFPLEAKTDFSRIAAQSARQAVIQKIHEAERQAAIAEFEGKEHTIVHGQVQRFERGNVFVDLGRTVAFLPYFEQIRGEQFKQGDTVRAYIKSIDTTRRRGGFVQLSRACPEFVIKLFEMEVPELADGVLEIKAIARDSGVRTKIAVETKDATVDPVGSFVGQRGVRVMTVKSELGGEQIDIINWSGVGSEFVTEALLPAEVAGVTVDEEAGRAFARTSDEQIPIAIGRSGQNIRLASQLTGMTIVIVNSEGVTVASATPEGEVNVMKQDGHAGKRESERTDGDEFESAESHDEVHDDGSRHGAGIGDAETPADGDGTPRPPGTGNSRNPKTGTPTGMPCPPGTPKKHRADPLPMIPHPTGTGSGRRTGERTPNLMGTPKPAGVPPMNPPPTARTPAADSDTAADGAETPADGDADTPK